MPVLTFVVYLVLAVVLLLSFNDRLIAARYTQKSLKWASYFPYFIALLLALWGVVTGESLPRTMALVVAVGFSLLRRQQAKVTQRDIEDQIVDVVDYLSLADEAQIDFGRVLHLASQSVYSPKLQKELARAAAEYALTQDMISVTGKLAERLAVEEAQYLPLIAAQTQKTGTANAMLDMLSASLHAKHNAELYSRDKAADYKVVGAAFLLAAGIFLVYFVPYYTASQVGLSNIFL